MGDNGDVRDGDGDVAVVENIREDGKGEKEGEKNAQNSAAKLFSDAQHRESWKEAIKANPKALLWCLYSLFTCIMWGYDGLASSIVLAITQFRQDYGTVFEGQYVVPAIWQLALGGASLLGLLLGGLGATVMAKKWGRQLCMGLSYVFTVAGVFLQWFSSPGNLPMLFGGKVLTGIPLGVFVTIAPTYCSEIAPLVLRGAVTSAVNWSIVLGQCLAYVVMRQTQYIANANSYRILFAVQWIFAGIALVILPWFPESPYLLIAQGRVDKARVNARRFYSAGFDYEGLISSIMLDLETQSKTQTEGSFKKCFQGRNSIRTLIAMSTFFIQSVSGIGWIIGYMAYFLQLGGLSTAAAFNATVGLSFLMLVGNMLGWILVERFGRRGTAFWGALVLTATLLMIGISAVIPSPRAIWAQVFFMAIWSVVYQSTIGSVAWPIITEVSTSSLRSHTQSLATMTTGIVGAVSGVLLPFAVNPDMGNLGGKIAFIYGGILGLSCFGIWSYYPETKGRTFAEIDRLFEMGIRPRDFEKTKLDIDA